MTTGYIYVIKNEVGGLGGFKIGQTINPPRRFRELKLGTKSSLVGLWRSDKYASIERFLHKTFKHLRVPQSEWFALTPDVLQDVISRLNRCSTCIKLESEYKPAQPVVVLANKPDGSTYPVPVKKDTWKEQSVYAEHKPYSQPKIVDNRCEPWAAIFCAIPVLGWVLMLASLCDTKNQLYKPGFKPIAIISSIISLCLIASAEAKPLHTYQQQPHINVSSLIK